MLGPMRFFAVFALVALAEMATFFWVESKIGLIWALGLALVTALVGSFLVRRAGLSVSVASRPRWVKASSPDASSVTVPSSSSPVLS